MIVDCDPVIGYLHRGMEKLGEAHRYAQVIPWTDRTDYVAAPMNNLGCVLAIEKLCGVDAPERAQYWRVIMSELARIASHLVWLGTHALDIGALSMSLYCFRERELILDIFEAFCGARLTTNMMEIGGFSRPIPEDLPEHGPRLPARSSRSASRSTPTCSTANPIWMARTKGVGVIPPEAAINYSLTGACLRGSGVNYDIRKAMPYCVYDRLDFEVPLGHARRRLRPLPRAHGRDAADDQDHRPVRSTQCERMDTPADGLRIGVRHPAAQGHDDDRRGHAASLHLGDQGIQPAGRRGLRRGRAPQGRDSATTSSPTARRCRTASGSALQTS